MTTGRAIRIAVFCCWCICSVTMAEVKSREIISLSAEATGDIYQTTVKSEISINQETGEGRFLLKYQSTLGLCNNSGDVVPIDLEIIFVLGEGENTQMYRYPMNIACTTFPEMATFSFDSKDGFRRYPWSTTRLDDPNIWNRIFPQRDEGKRWFAVRVGFIRSLRGTNVNVDNLNGDDYRLVFE